MLNKIIAILIIWLFPYPLVSGILAHLAIKYKYPILAFFLSFLLMPVLLLSTLFGSTTNVKAADELKYKRAYFDRKYSIICRQDPSKCEPKPGLLSFLGCTIDPTLCRLKRPKVDCSIEAQKVKYCSQVDGLLSATSQFEELFYRDQQEAEENAGSFGKYSNSTGLRPGETIDRSGSPGSPLDIATLPPQLVGYLEPYINDTGTPNGNPLGGQGFENSFTTCIYHCPDYLDGGLHQGMDLTPSLQYYNLNRASGLVSGRVVQFATCSGLAKYEQGYLGSNNVVIKCKDTDYYVTYMHLSTAYIPVSPVAITAGQPIGLMGSTGYSTGPHIHYQINKGCIDYTTSCTRDPVPFISP